MLGNQYMRNICLLEGDREGIRCFEIGRSVDILIDADNKTSDACSRRRLKTEDGRLKTEDLGMTDRSSSSLRSFLFVLSSSFFLLLTSHFSLHFSGAITIAPFPSAATTTQPTAPAMASSEFCVTLKEKSPDFDSTMKSALGENVVILKPRSRKQNTAQPFRV